MSVGLLGTLDAVGSWWDRKAAKLPDRHQYAENEKDFIAPGERT